MAGRTGPRTEGEDVSTGGGAASVDTEGGRQTTAAGDSDSSCILHSLQSALRMNGHAMRGAQDSFLTQSARICLRDSDYFEGRFFRCFGAGFRNRRISSAVNRTHQGLLGLAWIPSSFPDLHQSAIVDTVTFRIVAAARAP